MRTLESAIAFALKAHAGQPREDDDPFPYFTHPIEVLNHLRYVGGVEEEDLLCVAALHDVIEGGGATLVQVRREFGERIAGLVQELTRTEPTPAETAGLDKDAVWTLRANLLLDDIRRMSPEAQTVKLADRLANLQDALRTKRGRKLERYLWQTEQILRIVPPAVNPDLHRAIAKGVKKGEKALSANDR